MQNTAKRIARSVGIVRSYRASQLLRRAIKLIGNRAFPNRLVRVASPPTDLRLLEFTHAQKQCAAASIVDYADHVSHSQSDLESGEVCLLNSPESLGRPFDWNKDFKAKPHLWRFHLHYHEYLLAQLAKQGGSAIVWELIESWIRAFPPRNVRLNQDEWHPYCISRRIPSWLWCLATSRPEDNLRSEIEVSLWQQAEHLSLNLELDIGGNHLLENLTALALIASVLECPQRKKWLAAVEKFLPSELARQILDTGEHFERAPAYHCQVAGNLLRLLAFLPHELVDLRRTCLAKAVKAIEFIASILHQDQEIPLFADSVFAEAPSIEQLKRLTTINGLDWPNVSSTPMQIGGYAVFRDQNTTAVFDCGDVGAKSLPAHAHSDALGIEYVTKGVRWLSDSGNFNYEDDEMRRYCRSAHSHNVATIDGRNHFDLWSKFRAVGLPSVKLTKFVRDPKGVAWAIGETDAYRNELCGALTRCVFFDPAGNMCVVDVAPAANRGCKKLIGNVHFGADVVVDKQSAARLRLESTSATCEFKMLQSDFAELGESWYCPAFGFRKKRQKMEYSHELQNFATFSAWAIGPCIPSIEIQLEDTRLSMVFDENVLHLDLAAHS